MEKLDHIKENPYSRLLVQDKFLASLGIRSIKVKNHLIFYRIKEGEKNKYVTAVRFMYSKRDWSKHLKENPFGDIL